MKKRVIFFLFAVCVISLVSAEIPKDCDGSMISYWKFDGNSIDSLGRFNGSGNNEWEPVYSKVGLSAKFNGNQKITVADANALDLAGGFTVMFWFQKTNANHFGGAFVNKTNYAISYSVKSDYSGSYVKSQVGDKELTSNLLALMDTPYFVTLTLNSTNKNLTLYINGNPVNSTTLSSTLSPTTSPLIFGEGFEGIIDEAAFFNRSLTQEEITKYYTRSNSGNDYCYSPAGSSTQTDFTISGCNLPGGGSVSAGLCSSDGNFYCSSSAELFRTISDNQGCLGGVNIASLDSRIKNRLCCPDGYYCNISSSAVSANDVTCVQLEESCSSFTTVDACEDNACYWATTGIDTNVCTDSLSGLGCSAYTNQDYCQNDSLRLAQRGYGTTQCTTSTQIICGRSRFVRNGCQCVWSENQCKLSQKLSPDFFTAQTNYTFTCEQVFKMSDCIDGIQNVTTNSTLINKETGTMPADGWTSLENCITAAAKCEDSEATRYCGKPIAKVPGFSAFAFTAAVLIIAAFYIKRHRAVTHHNEKRK